MAITTHSDDLKNLDLAAMKLGNRIVKTYREKETQKRAKEIKKEIGEALTILQGDGIYALMLHLKKNCIWECLINDEIGKRFLDGGAEVDSLKLVEKLVADLPRLFLAIDYFSLAMTYARHQADVEG